MIRLCQQHPFHGSASMPLPASPPPFFFCLLPPSNRLLPLRPKAGMGSFPPPPLSPREPTDDSRGTLPLQLSPPSFTIPSAIRARPPAPPSAPPPAPPTRTHASRERGGREKGQAGSGRDEKGKSINQGLDASCVAYPLQSTLSSLPLPCRPLRGLPLGVGSLGASKPLDRPSRRSTVGLEGADCGSQSAQSTFDPRHYQRSHPEFDMEKQMLQIFASHLFYLAADVVYLGSWACTATGQEKASQFETPGLL